MGQGRNWTQEEHDYLAEHWGTTPIPTLCKTLDRSKSAILLKVHKMRLPAFLDAGDYITLNQLLEAVTGTNSAYSYKMQSWVQNRDLPIHYKQVNGNKWRVVYIKEFWRWAEKNRSFLDFSKMEPLALGKEPEWVDDQRRCDHHAFAIQRKDPWTISDDDRLKAYLKLHRYGYAELSKMLTRSAGAIQRRICDLGIKERPIRADKNNEWTHDNYIALADGIRAGNSYTQIGNIIGRSEKAVRGKVYYTYLTENADRVRAMLGDGEWGSGAPDPKVKQAINHSKYKKDTLQSLANLAGVLSIRRNELGYDPYWQRFMCINWHDVKGCTAGCENCDTCAEFLRVRPQYCARCGCTFYERMKNTFCASCRTARKRNGQRKYARQIAKGV